MTKGKLPQASRVATNDKGQRLGFCVRCESGTMVQPGKTQAYCRTCDEITDRTFDADPKAAKTKPWSGGEPVAAVVGGKVIRGAWSVLTSIAMIVGAILNLLWHALTFVVKIVVITAFLVFGALAKGGR